MGSQRWRGSWGRDPGCPRTVGGTELSPTSPVSTHVTHINLAPDPHQAPTLALAGWPPTHTSLRLPPRPGKEVRQRQPRPLGLPPGATTNQGPTRDEPGTAAHGRQRRGRVPAAASAYQKAVREKQPQSPASPPASFPVTARFRPSAPETKGGGPWTEPSRSHPHSSPQRPDPAGPAHNRRDTQGRKTPPPARAPCRDRLERRGLPRGCGAG